MINHSPNSFGRNTILAILILLPALLYGQQLPQPGFNFGFEKVSEPGALPDNWMIRGDAHSIKADTVERHSGQRSVSLTIGPADQRYQVVEMAIPARYNAKEIELRAYMKLQDVNSGFAALSLRVEGVHETLEWVYTPNGQLHGTKDWAQYSVTAPYPRGADTIYISARLYREGQLWIDDLELLLDGKDIHSIVPRKTADPEIIADRKFAVGSGIEALPLTSHVIDNLTTLGKVWGFLKYYHPAVARGEYNWDYELFSILPRVLKAKDKSECDKILMEWITSLGEVKEEKQKAEISGEVKLLPELGWLDSPDFPPELAAQLTRIRNAERSKDHQYIEKDRSGRLLFKNETSYPKMDYPDAGYRLLSLFRYWNYVQYFFPYKNLIGEEWDGVLKEYIPMFSAASGELEYKLTVLSLITRIHDSHAIIMSNEPVLDQHWGMRYAPLELSFVEEEVVVSGYYDQALGKNTGLVPGDIIEQINGKPVEAIIRERLPFTPGSNDATRLRDLVPELLRTNSPWINVNYDRSGEKYDARLQSYPAGTFNMQKSYPNDTCFKFLAPDIAYLYGGTVKPDYIPSIVDALKSKDVKGLIIDMRTHPFVSYYEELCDYLLPRQTDHVALSSGSIRYPGLFTITRKFTVGKRNRDFFKGKVMILINEDAQSAAEFHTMAFQTAPDVTLIGSHTAGADGDMIRFRLPGGILTSFSGVGVYYPDGTVTQRVGIVPDIVVKPTIEGIRQGRDEVLEAAVKRITSEVGATEAAP